MKATRRKTYRVLLIIALALTIVGCSANQGNSTSEASSSTAATITVTGFGKARANPDRASVNVGVIVVEEDINRAVEESNEIIARITDAVMGLGVEEADVQTTNFSIWADEQWNRETGLRMEERLYRVESTIQINVNDIENIGEILEVSIASGANNIYGLNFGIQDPSSLSAEARVRAIEDARQRAQHIAQELGVTLGEVQRAVDISGASMVPYFESTGYDMGGGGAPPISEGSMTVSVSMEITFEINR
ncbi:MAG: SIMPL domain-containing protein [Anaerolineaceae bacterium]|nr:MAG: SIMPL domain-containing protein [Anaerolineaceae bacterium]